MRRAGEWLLSRWEFAVWLTALAGCVIAVSLRQRWDNWLFLGIVVGYGVGRLITWQASGE